MLESPRLAYRAIEERDTERVLAWRNSDAVRLHFIYRKAITPEEHLRWLHEKVFAGLVEQYIVAERESSREIGSVYFQHIDRAQGTAEYGVFIGEADVCGKGYGTEIAKAAVAHAFGAMGLQELTLRVLAANGRAIRCYRKAGFAEGGRPAETAWIDGAEEKVVFMSIRKG